jgi:ribonuclease HI
VPKLIENALVIYTDGSLYPKGRKGGYGIVFVHVNEIGEEEIVREESPPGITQGATGNRMELKACVAGFRLAPEIGCFAKVGKVVVRTDSRYVHDNYKRAMVWRGQRWRTGDGRPVDNADLWKDFLNAYAKVRKPKLIEWIKGHGKGRFKNPHNVRADTLAKGSATSPLRTSEYRSSVRKKFAPGVTKPGSVRLLGQTMVIYVVEVIRMRMQKTWKYRYQVASKDSPDYQAIDWIYSDEQMRDGHFYEVEVNDDMRHPQVLVVVREIRREELTNG